jgi:hypothetical protein
LISVRLSTTYIKKFIPDKYSFGKKIIKKIFFREVLEKYFFHKKWENIFEKKWKNINARAFNLTTPCIARILC